MLLLLLLLMSMLLLSQQTSDNTVYFMHCMLYAVICDMCCMLWLWLWLQLHDEREGHRGQAPGQVRHRSGLQQVVLVLRRRLVAHLSSYFPYACSDTAATTADILLYDNAV